MKSDLVFNKILSVNKTQTKYKTLGRRSFFYVKAMGDKLEITNSKKKQFFVDKEMFASVYLYFQSLKYPDNLKSTFYTDTHWNGCRNRVFSPYIAAIIASHTLK